MGNKVFGKSPTLSLCFGKKVIPTELHNSKQWNPCYLNHNLNVHLYNKCKTSIHESQSTHTEQLKHKPLYYNLCLYYRGCNHLSENISATVSQEVFVMLQRNQTRFVEIKHRIQPTSIVIITFPHNFPLKSFPN